MAGPTAKSEWFLVCKSDLKKVQSFARWNALFCLFVLAAYVITISSRNSDERYLERVKTVPLSYLENRYRYLKLTRPDLQVYVSDVLEPRRALLSSVQRLLLGVKDVDLSADYAELWELEGTDVLARTKEDMYKAIVTLNVFNEACDTLSLALDFDRPFGELNLGELDSLALVSSVYPLPIGAEGIDKSLNRSYFLALLLHNRSATLVYFPEAREREERLKEVDLALSHISRDMIDEGSGLLRHVPFDDSKNKWLGYIGAHGPQASGPFLSFLLDDISDVNTNWIQRGHIAEFVGMEPATSSVADFVLKRQAVVAKIESGGSFVIPGLELTMNIVSYLWLFCLMNLLAWIYTWYLVQSAKRSTTNFENHISVEEERELLRPSTNGLNPLGLNTWAYIAIYSIVMLVPTILFFLDGAKDVIKYCLCTSATTAAIAVSWRMHSFWYQHWKSTIVLKRSQFFSTLMSKLKWPAPSANSKE